jgi:peptidoglycan/xylan/chitin deacetylase (PgdA/CDA1 family)
VRTSTTNVAVVLVGVGMLAAGCATLSTTLPPIIHSSSSPAGASAPSVPTAPPTPSESDAPEQPEQPEQPVTTPADDPAAPAPITTHKPPTAKPTPRAPKGLRLGGPAGSAMRVRSSKVVLTFDDGPDPVQTPRLLDLLATNHVKATFCLVGTRVRAHPELVRRIVDEGHTLCNHSWRHSLTLGRQDPDEIRADLRRTNDAIHQAVPDATIAYLRAPGGNFTPAMVEVAADLGMASIYWAVDPRDWDHPAGESAAAHRAKVIADVKAHTRPGAIILSHDNLQPDTIDAYQTLIPWLKQRYGVTRLP